MLYLNINQESKWFVNQTVTLTSSDDVTVMSSGTLAEVQQLLIKGDWNESKKKKK